MISKEAGTVFPLLMCSALHGFLLVLAGLRSWHRGGSSWLGAVIQILKAIGEAVGDFVTSFHSLCLQPRPQAVLSAELPSHREGARVGCVQVVRMGGGGS